jgi:hypothetical protein
MTRRTQKLWHVRSDSSQFTACRNAPGRFWCIMQSLPGDCRRHCKLLVRCGSIMRGAWLSLLGGARMLVAGCDFAMLFSTHVARLKGWLMQDPRTR